MRESNRLNAKFVEQASTPGVHRDGAGLLLRVVSKRSKSWVLRTTKNKKRQDIGLGSARDISLREARNLAHELRRTVRLGGNPLPKRRADWDRCTLGCQQIR